MTLKEKIKSNPRLKKLVHWMLIPTGDAKPRLWVKLFVNPFVHKRGKGSKIRWYAVLDVIPFNKFNLGNWSTIEHFCNVNNGVGDVTIGYDSLIGRSNIIIGPVTIGNNVIFAPNVVASGLNHEYRDIKVPIRLQKIIVAPIIVEDNCWIGANSVITSGVTIGRHSVIAAGAVVTKNIPPYSVAVGNPARVIKQYDEASGEWVSVKN
ncbi:acyltransferase [Mucilaginibacter calamicampi]|uniref:Acyltransferase n=1 Tax=Mucilaginibacter calamicampi TaxID=1302352 RepID=A0ABW2YSL0_9SPHI